MEGQTIAVEDRWADGQSDRFAGLLDEMIQSTVDVIVQASTPGALAAKKMSTMIPIVFWGVIDPVGLHLVASLAHPGGNMTGLALDTEEGLPGKWVELFKETMPRVVRIGALWNPDARGLERRVADRERRDRMKPPRRQGPQPRHRRVLRIFKKIFRLERQLTAQLTKISSSEQPAAVARNAARVNAKLRRAVRAFMRLEARAKKAARRAARRKR